MSDSGVSRPVPKAQAGQFKYWAFLSYSHQDKKWADWLHRKLETYRVPKPLIGRETRSGRIPKRLFPVFRDVEELPTASDLNKAITTALRQSRYLVVICSPQSAKSLWVNEEILAFKRMGRSDRLLCLIVAGEPNAADKPQLGLEECFPPAARFEIDPHGRLTDRRTEPIAADVRLAAHVNFYAKLRLLFYAKLKIIAGILGIGFDELYLRDWRRRCRRRIVAAALTVVILSVFGGFAILMKHQFKEVQREAVVLDELEAKITNLPFPRMSGEYSPEEIEQLKTRQAGLAEVYRLVARRVESGLVSELERFKAAYELSLAEAELAWAENDMLVALQKLEQTANHADQYAERALYQYEAGMRDIEAVSAARKSHAEAQLALVRMRQVLDAMAAGGQGGK